MCHHFCTTTFHLCECLIQLHVGDLESMLAISQSVHPPSAGWMNRNGSLGFDLALQTMMPMLVMLVMLVMLMMMRLMACA